MRNFKFNKRVLYFALILFVLGCLLVLWAFVIGIRANQPGSYYNKGHNAIWLGHEWAQDFKSDSEIEDLVNKLKDHQIDTIFVHSGPLEENGKISPARYAAILNFVDKVKARDNGIKILAWLGQIRTKLNLGDPEIRENIVRTAQIFTEMAGMDGVHYDIEPVWDNDLDFIELLKETRAGISTDGGKIISVALAEFIPNSFIWWTANVFDFKNYNTELNYLNVASYADQIVDMVYDTGIDRKFLYEWFVKEQVIWVTDLLKNLEDERKVEFLVGIPAYEEVKEGFNPEAENVGSGIVGIINGLNDIRSTNEYFDGIAIYAEFEMSEVEWGIYDALWKK